jgi:peptidoglycan/LPS O-acetylase OafA/YrhL
MSAAAYAGEAVAGVSNAGRRPAVQLPALTGLRFFLALWVILHHLTGPGQSLAATIAPVLPAPLFALIRGGYQAVTTFFVLSGFVLTRSYWRGSWTRGGLTKYYRGRLARVYPVYLLSLIVVAPFIIADAKWGYLAAHLTLTQAWLGPIPVGWNTPAWSLSCEMFFYAVFPLLGAFLVRRVTWRWVVALGALACVLTPAMEAAGVPDAIKPLVHLSDFLMGIVAACGFELAQGKVRGWWLYVPGFAGAAAAIAWAQWLPIDLNSVLRPLNAALIVGLAMGCPWLSGRALVYLGKSSYAMYILHVPIMWWYLREARLFSAAVYVGIVIAASLLVYAAVESPANRWLRRVRA